jgi:hypothetical protein
MSLGTALFSIFCTPLGWIGLICLSLVIVAVWTVTRRPMFGELSEAQINILHRLLHIEMLQARRRGFDIVESVNLEMMYGEIWERKREFENE